MNRADVHDLLTKSKFDHSLPWHLSPEDVGIELSAANDDALDLPFDMLVTYITDWQKEQPEWQQQPT